MAIDMASSSPAPEADDAALQPSDDLLCEYHDVVIASDLYAHHILPSIMADLQAMGVADDLRYHADIQAEMRWSLLDVQQQGFWYKHIKMFRKGSLKSLDVSTYEDFCARRNLLQDDRDRDADDMRDTPQVPTAPFKFMSSTPLDSIDQDLHGKKSTATALTSAGGTDSGTTNGIQTARAAPPVVPPRFTQSVVSKLEAAMRATVPEAKADTLRHGTINTTKFTFTAAQLAEAASFAAEATRGGGKQKGKAGPAGIPQQYTVVDVQSNTVPAAPVRKKRSKKSKQVVARGAQENDHDNAILHFLGGAPMWLVIPDYTTGMSIILQSLLKHLGNERKLTLQGRCQTTRARVDFDPRASGVTSIKARLVAAVARGEWIEPIYRKLWSPKATMGYMLRYLIDWNRHVAAFQGLESINVKIRGAQGCENDYVSRCVWLESSSSVVGPITYQRRHAVVDIIMQLLRERAERLCPAALRTGMYGLLQHDQSFARELLSCFTYTTLSHDEYEDLMEQKMFRLNRKFGRLALTQR